MFCKSVGSLIDMRMHYLSFHLKTIHLKTINIKITLILQTPKQGLFKSNFTVNNIKEKGEAIDIFSYCQWYLYRNQIYLKTEQTRGWRISSNFIVRVDVILTLNACSSAKNMGSVLFSFKYCFKIQCSTFMQKKNEIYVWEVVQIPTSHWNLLEFGQL